MMWRLEGGQVLGPKGISVRSLVLDGGVIGDGGSGGTPLDAHGLLVLPGIVDIHGDGFERQIQPRPKVAFPHDVALRETDNQLISNGITTAYHGLTVSWEPGLRSVEAAREFLASLRVLRPELACDTKLHIRWETFALDVLDEVTSWLAEETDPIFALNDHTTPVMQGAQAQIRKLGSMAARTGLSESDYKARLADIWARRDQVPEAIKLAAARVEAAGARLFAHDEASPEARGVFRALGAHVSEFPMTEATAKAAREAGEHTVLGAPNVLRGGSHNGAMDATHAVLDGLCSVLTSDYYYPAALLAPFRLAADHGLPIAETWRLVSANAAEAAGLADRGVLEPGRRADVLLVDASDMANPRLVCCFVAGRKVFDRRS